MLSNRSRLGNLIERISAIEMVLINREEDVQKEALAEWKRQKVGCGKAWQSMAKMRMVGIL